MQLSLRVKLNVAFVVMMIGFMIISTMISFLVSRMLTVNHLIESNESELSISIDNMQDLLDKSKVKFRFFMDDLKFSFKDEQEDYVTFLKNATEINSHLKNFLYSNREFSKVFVFYNDMMIGTSLVNEIMTYMEGKVDHPDPDGLNKNILDRLEQYRGANESGVHRENLIIARADNGAYIAAVLDLDFIATQNKLRLTKVDREHQVVYGEEYVNAVDLMNIIPGTSESGIYMTQRFGDVIVSMLKRSEGDIYLLEKDIGTINENFNLQLIKVIGIGGGICLFFVLISWLWTRKMLDPVYEFIRKLKEVKDFSNRKPMKDYFTTYKGHSSVYQKIFMYYLLVFIPVSLMIGISFVLFKNITISNIHKEYLHIAEKAAGSVESRIGSYESYLKYLSLDREFQESIVKAHQTSSPETEQYLSHVLMKKGVVDLNLDFISIYNPDHQSLYSNTPKLFIQPEDAKDGGAYESKESIQLISNNEGAGSVMAVMRNNIRYLGDIRDKSGFFDDLGYIEIGVKNLMDKDKGFTEKNSVSLSIIDNYKNMHIMGSNLDKHNYEYLENLLKRSTVAQMEHHYASMGEAKAMIILYPLMKKNWLLVYFIPVEWETQEYIMLMLYMVELIVILLIITFISYYLGRRMTSPIRKAIAFMEEFKDDYSERLDQSDRDFEFVVLAKSFNTMLGRLEQLSTELREKEIENFEMDKRINKLLLKALKSQINPHFLHNIFTSIVLLLKTGRIEKATDMLVSTAEFLKTGLYGTQDLVQLKEEIEHATYYLNIQNIRYNGRMQCTIDIDRLFETCQVPKFILQPLIENAIHHGMKSGHTLHIQVICRRADENLFIIRIEDNGCGMTSEKLTSVISDMRNQMQTAHYGLSNVNERIQLEFGKSYGLNIHSHPDEGTVVEVHLPFFQGVMKDVGLFADDRR